ncbi:unnamed protein product [Adineta ricciae]|uniref:Uncharacterized protein n=1 Tax=Adineta ricciae TaxID=249248 RepID=A0A813XGG9_ADIRI|nr:unnamed protein product [Adineta ricciae]
MNVFRVSSTAPIIIFYGQGKSTLRTALMEYVKNVDITLICFSIDTYMWQWLESHSTKTVASLVVQPGSDFRNIIDCSHKYNNVYSVLVRCTQDQILTLQRFVRSYARVDGIFDSDQRLLVKLFIDLTLISEELGDEQREDAKNEFAAQKHYDRALKFCALVKKM